MEEDSWRKKQLPSEKKYYNKEKRFHKEHGDTNQWQVKKSNNYRKDKDNKYRRRFRNSNLNQQKEKDKDEVYIMFKNNILKKSWIDIINYSNNNNNTNQKE